MMIKQRGWNSWSVGQTTSTSVNLTLTTNSFSPTKACRLSLPCCRSTIKISVTKLPSSRLFLVVILTWSVWMIRRSEAVNTSDLYRDNLKYRTKWSKGSSTLSLCSLKTSRVNWIYWGRRVHSIPLKRTRLVLRSRRRKILSWKTYLLILSGPFWESWSTLTWWKCVSSSVTALRWMIR